MLRAVIFVALIFCSTSLRAQSVDPRAHSSTGIRRVSEDTSTYRANGGIGVNLGKITNTPYVYSFQLTRAATNWFYGLGLNLSQNVSNRDTFRSSVDFDLLIGLSWDSGVPHYEENTSRLHFSLATGLAVESYAVQVRIPGIPSIGPRSGRGRFQTIETESKMGIPLQFSAIYEFWRYLGVGAKAFYAVSGLAPNYGLTVILEARY